MSMQEIIRRHIQKQYIGRCDIEAFQEVTEDCGLTAHKAIMVQKDIPCRLSYKSASKANGQTGAMKVEQQIRLLLPPEIEVMPGSRITIRQNGVTAIYKNSGYPCLYENHKEVSMERLEEWA